MSKSERDKSLELVLSSIEKQFGKGAIMRMGALDGSESVAKIPSGSLGLDIALGIGGYPRGLIAAVGAGVILGAWRPKFGE